jgi:hypothetical protein
MTRAGHVAWTEEVRNAYKILIGKVKRITYLGRPMSIQMRIL